MDIKRVFARVVLLAGLGAMQACLFRTPLGDRSETPGDTTPPLDETDDEPPVDCGALPCDANATGGARFALRPNVLVQRLTSASYSNVVRLGVPAAPATSSTYEQAPGTRPLAPGR